MVIQPILNTLRFGGGFTSWGQPFRLKHIVTGRYLGIKTVGITRTINDTAETETKQRSVLYLVDPKRADKETTAFRFIKTTVRPSHAINGY